MRYTKFEDFYNILVFFLQKQYEFIEKLKEFINKEDQALNNKLNKYMNKLIYECINKIDEYSYLSTDNSHEIFNILHKSNISKNYSAIFYLEKFSKYEEDIVLIGGNGSGKTSFANFLKGNDNELITVIPAQKNLYYSANDPYLSKTSKDDLKNILIENNIEKGEI
ncbi:MAG: hypothetical protein U0N02_00350 [Clostridia bacterium]